MNVVACKMTKTYEDFVKFREQKNPCLQGLSKFLAAAQRMDLNSSKLYVVNCCAGALGIDAHHGEQLPHGDLALALLPPPSGQGRVVIIEDLHPSLLESLGSALDIDPIFFADHILTSFEDIEFSPAPPSVALPPSSIISRENWFHIHYQQIVDLGFEDKQAEQTPWVLKTSGNVQRSVRRLIPLRGRQLGIVRGCCSILKQVFEQSWVCIILVDPTHAQIADSPGCRPRFRRLPLHNGFEDFQQPPSFSSFQSLAPGRDDRKSSLLNSIVRYVSESPLPVNATPPTLLGLAYYPLRVIIGEWMIYSQILSRYLTYYEVSIRDVEVRTKKYEIVDLQKWRHRAIQSVYKIESTRAFVAHHLATEDDDKAKWELVIKDLDHLSRTIELYIRAFEGIIPVITSLVQLSDSHQSLSEAVDVKLLMYVALVFVPLSWIASIFSMTDDFAPGNSRFWVYFAVATPFSILVVILSMLASKIQVKT
ncbi:hypothetical protein HD806DRAFT_515574 [Xylariaceae sp. AK1471]|nr:hypothetical protein HD806DRAFT_515574 [Xylariaceae sp. AK1471]